MIWLKYIKIEKAYLTCLRGVGQQQLQFACWNIRTMYDSDISNRQSCQSALIAHELKRLDVNNAALSEIHFSGEDILKELCAGYTPYWSGKPETGRHLLGVSFMIKESITSKLTNLPTGHSDCSISMCLPLHDKQYVTLISVYAPTLQADSVERDRFYTNLQCLPKNIPANDKIFIPGDFNIRVGWDAVAWKGVLGKTWNRKLRWQWVHFGWILCWTVAFYHKQIFPTQNVRKLPGCTLSTLAHARLYTCTRVEHERHPSHLSDAKCCMSHRSWTCS